MNLVGVRPIPVLKWLYFLPGVLVAGIADVDRLWVVANIAVGSVAIPNLFALLCLSGVFRKLMTDEVTGTRAYAMERVDAEGPLLRGIGAR